MYFIRYAADERALPFETVVTAQFERQVELPRARRNGILFIPLLYRGSAASRL
jgi:hypothetical protein